jgi:hypothetical protein
MRSTLASLNQWTLALLSRTWQLARASIVPLAGFGAVAGVVLVWLLQHEILDYAEERWQGPPDGIILVSHPEIFTRERLVNDRLEHINWVNSLVRRLDGEQPGTFQASQGTVWSNRNSTLSMTGAESGLVERPPPSRSSPAAQATTTAAASEQPSEVRPSSLNDFHQRNLYRNELRAERMRSMLDDRHDIAGNTILQLNFNATVVPTNPGKRGFALVAVRLSGLEDPQRNLDELYGDWVAYLTAEIEWSVEVRRFVLTSSVPMTPASAAESIRALLLRACSARLRGSSQHERPRVVACEHAIDQRETSFSAAEVHRAVLRAQAESALGELRNLLDALKGEARDAARKRYRAAIESFLQLPIVREEATKAGVQTLDALHMLEDIEYRCVTVSQQDPGSGTLVEVDSLSPSNMRRVERLLSRRTAAGEGAENVFRLRIPCAPIFGNREMLAVLHAVATRLEWTAAGSLLIRPSCLALQYSEAQQDRWIYGDCKGDDPLVVSMSLTTMSCIAAHWRRTDLLAPIQPRTRSQRTPANDREWGADRLSNYVDLDIIAGPVDGCFLRPRPSFEGRNRLGEELTRLAESSDLYAYGVLPRSAAQWHLLDQGRQAEVDLAGSGASRVTSSVGLASQARFRGGVDESFIVGFGTDTRDRRPQRTGAVFGWVIGPRRAGVDNRHLMDTHTLSAIVSVPSWWRAARLTVNACWVASTKVPLRPQEIIEQLEKDENAPGCQLTHFHPRLPGSEAELQRVLSIEVVRTPFVRMLPESENFNAVAGQRAAFRIEGGRLWRSTMVTLGAQVAERVSVLPNMLGIVAEFDCVEVPSITFSNGRPQGPASRRRGTGPSTGEDGPPEREVAVPSGPPSPEVATPEVGTSEPSRNMQRVPLQVWTSEGVTSPLFVHVAIAPNAVCGPRGASALPTRPPEPSGGGQGIVSR